MARTKISEFSATAADNTDIDGIDIAEGCAPSGINNAIRTLMADLKNMQTGASGDTFTFASLNATTANIDGGTIDGATIGGSSAAAGTFTSLTSNSTTTLNGTTIPASKTLVDTDSSQTLTNKTISADSNTLSGIAASSFVLSNASGNIDGAAAQKAIPAGVVVGTTDTQTLTNKTLSTGTAITAGTINGAAIGGTTPAAGAFTTLSASDASVISVNSASTALRITQTGAGNALVVEDSANPDATPFVVNADGKAIVGYTTPISAPDALGTSRIPSAEVITNDSDIGGSIGLFAYRSNNTGTPYVTFSKAAGTIASPSALTNAYSTLGSLLFQGYDGSSFINAAAIQGSVDGTPGTNDMPGRLVFSTTADGASSPTERMRIRSDGNVSIGDGGNASQTLRIVAPTTGGTSASSVHSAATIQSDVTAGAATFFSVPSTAAASFTLTSLRHFDAAQGTFGAGSTVTNQYGFNASSNLIGATNNYGFFSNIASGTGRWNFYANGTAANYFAGNVGIGGAPAELLDIYSNARAFMQITRASTNNVQPVFSFRKARGTTAAYTTVVSDDNVGDIQFYGYDGTNFIQVASITATVDGTPGTNDMPGRLSFFTTLDGASASTERLRISAAGTVSLQNNAGLSIARTAVTSPAASDGNVFSGTYTPTLTNTTNVASSTASVGQYIRVGNVVTVSGQVTIQATAANVDTVLTFSLPIASNLSSSVQLGGTGSSTTPGAYGINNVGIMGDTTADAAIFRLRPNTTSAQAYAFSFTYQVI